MSLSKPDFTSLTTKELNQVLSRRASMVDQNSMLIVDRKVEGILKLDQTINANPQVYIQEIVFRKCIFMEDVFIGDYRQAGPISFEDCTFEKKVEFTHYQNNHLGGTTIFKNDTLINSHETECKLVNIEFSKSFTINGDGKVLTLEKTNSAPSQPQNSKIFVDSHYRRIEIIDIFADSLHYMSKNNGVTTTLRLENSSLDVVDISQCPNLLKIIIVSCRVNNLLLQKADKLNHSVIIRSKSVIKNCEVFLRALQEFYTHESEIENIKFVGLNRKDNRVQIIHANISTLSFYNVINDGSIALSAINLRGDGKIAIESSNLGKIDFVNCDFSRAHLEFVNSKITEAFFSETEFPKRVRRSDEHDFPQAQLAFGQLATAFQKQGDTVRALEYQAREIQAHYRHTKWFSIDFFKKLNLWMNYISNNFGRNWVQAGFFSLVIGYAFFSLLLISTDKYRWGWHIPVEEFSAYMKFMNPLRFYDLDKLFETSLNPSSFIFSRMSYLADFLGRIFVAYGYYQTIQAFRRFGRK